MSFRTNLKDEIPLNGKRLYNIVDDKTGAVVNRNVRVVRSNGNTQEGDEFGANEVNQIHKSLNVMTNPNLLINGDFQIWQRGDSITQGNGQTYTADRWRVNISNNKTIVLRDAGGAGLILKPSDTTFGSLGQYIETPKEVRTALVGKAITISIRAKANRVVQSLRIDMGTQYQTYSLTTTYQTIFATFIVKESDFTNDSLLIKIMNTTTAFQVNDVLCFAWAKAEVGDIVTSFVPKLYSEELALCQRYFYILDSKAIYGNFGTFVMYNNSAQLYFPFDMETMRTRPTVLWGDFSGITLFAIKDFANIEILSKLTIAYSSGVLLLGMVNSYTNGISGSWQLKPNTQIIIDAEMY